ncbi:MAG: GDP-L-fucose synthase [Gammaproteobacteria bacterium]|nr:GDP-L-fucose synthase [Gammaproteobacteria bacterium]MDH4315333.1 GDP-L-fucose synthase [Gammaproteobacteria bacterium]MDH5215140.1 GDP-L-fucose synthase [Gammaproteobacteria bacterium]
MRKGSRIYVAGHRGLAGSAILRALQARGHENLLTRGSVELDLRQQLAVDSFFADEKPDFVFLAAARVGGILANDQFPGDFIRENLQIQTNVIDSAQRHGVRKLCFLGSSCIYPRLAPQPIREDSLLTGPLEPTNEWYAVAKIAGIKMCQAYRKQYGFNAISVMPTNLYGPGDNFDLQKSHVLPALMRKFDTAKRAGETSVTIWGSGTPSREFLYVDDLADACCFLMENYDSPEIINVGVGEDLTIAELAAKIRDIVGFTGTIEHDHSKPDGTPRKLLDVSRLQTLGWQASTSLDDGIRSTYRWFCENRDAVTS